MPRIVRFDEIGGPEVLKIEDLPPDEPGEGEVRIAVAALGLNYAEMMLRRGVYIADPVFPSRISLEAAGTIDALGPGVSGFTIGDRVGIAPAQTSDRFGNWTPESGKYGTYGESTLAPAHAVVRNPENVSDEVCAALWCQYLTAWGALIDYAGVTADDIVLVTAATSSAGLAGLQIAKDAGARVIAATRTAAKRDFLADQSGADAVIVTDDEELVPRVMEITSGQGFTVAYDPVGGPNIATLIAAAQPRGQNRQLRQSAPRAGELPDAADAGQAAPSQVPQLPGHHARCSGARPRPDLCPRPCPVGSAETGYRAHLRARSDRRGAPLHGGPDAHRQDRRDDLRLRP